MASWLMLRIARADIRAAEHIKAALSDTGRRCELVDDGEQRYLALAVRQA
jgi:hypothetical protein